MTMDSATLCRRAGGIVVIGTSVVAFGIVFDEAVAGRIADPGMIAEESIHS